MNNYEQRQEARRERLQARSERLREQGAASIERGSEMFKAIPMGQPILVGHSSEGADRNYRARAGRAISRGIELEKQAAEAEERAAAVGTGGISSDDPEAVTKLKAQHDNLTKLQDTMKKASAALRKNDDPALAALGFTPEKIAELKKPGCFGDIGFPRYALSNNNANIRRIEKRIRDLEVRDNTPAFKPITGNDWKCELLKEDNRIAFYFDAIPEQETRSLMKRHAFKWSPLRNAWVRMYTPNARYATKQLINSLNA
jgi:Domain of unknown function (DUF3560)